MSTNKNLKNMGTKKLIYGYKLKKGLQIKNGYKLKIEIYYTKLFFLVNIYDTKFSPKYKGQIFS